MRAPSTIAAVLPVAAAVAAVAGCGSGADKSSSTAAASAPMPAQSAKPAGFPQPDARTLQEMIKGMPQGPQLAPTLGTFEPGTDRIGFVLLDRARSFINGAGVALYVADADGSNAQGPFIAHSQSLAVDKTYRSATVAHDTAAPKAIYTAQVPMGISGRRVVIGLARLDGRMVATTTLPIALAKKTAGGPPTVGQRAIKISTPTVDSVGGDASTLDTRIPPAPALNQVDFAAALDHKPIVLLFATPKFCSSRTCGPVEDIIDELAHDAKFKRFAFVHQEIYRNNDPNQSFVPQVAAYRLQSEPWLFVIDRHGRIRGRIEGAFGADEVRSLLTSVH